MFDKFTDRARKILRFAREEAEKLNSEFIGTEHMLMGLIREDGGVASDVLKKLQVDLEQVRKEVEKMIAPPKEAPAYRGQLPFSPRAKKVLELSAEQALELNSETIGTEHLLLALVLENEGIAAQVLINMGLDLARVQQAVLDTVLLSKPVKLNDPLQKLSSDLAGNIEGPIFTKLQQAYDLGRQEERGRLRRLILDLGDSPEIKAAAEVLKKAINTIEKGLL